MTIPNIEVLRALFETYVNVRAKKWGVDVNAPSHVLIASIPKAKLDPIIELLNRFKDANSFEDWIKAIYLCDQKERSEEINETINKPFYERLFGTKRKEFLLKKTICAAQAYILSQLTSDHRYEEAIKALKKQKSDLEKKMQNDDALNMSEKVTNENNELMKEINQKLEALNWSPNYTQSYFHDIILERDPYVKRLSEQSFADYIKDAINGTRPYTVCPKLLGNPDNTQMNDTAKTEPQTQSNEPKPLQVAVVNQSIDHNEKNNNHTNSNSEESIYQKDQFKGYKPNTTPLGSHSTFAVSGQIPGKDGGTINHPNNLRNRYGFGTNS